MEAINISNVGTKPASFQKDQIEENDPSMILIIVLSITKLSVEFKLYRIWSENAAMNTVERISDSMHT